VNGLHTIKQPYARRVARLCALATLLIASRCASQDLRFDRLSTEQGLSQDIVTSIIQDRHGFLWFGTEDGLNRYDGYTVRTYKHVPADSTSVSGDWITTLCVDREGRLWIGTGSGLARYDDRYDRFTRITASVTPTQRINSPWITGIGQDSAGTIWVGSSVGFFRYDEGDGMLDMTASIDTMPNGLGWLHTDRRGRVWIGSNRGLYTVDPSSGTLHKFLITGSGTGGIDAGMITEIHEDAEGSLWISCSDSGLTCLNPARTAAKRYSLQTQNTTHLSTDIVHSVFIDGNGIVWVGTFVGLDRFDPRTETFQHFRSDPADPFSISGSRVYRVYSDRAGILWIGTYRGGVNHFDPREQRFVHFRHRPGVAGSISHDATYALLEDRHGRLWVGTPAGIDRSDGETRRFRKILDSRSLLGGNAVTALRERPDGTLWAGTESGQLLLLTPEGRILRSLLKESDYRARAGPRTVRALLEQTDGYLWIGTAETGLLKLDTRNWRLDRDPLAGTGVRFGAGVWVIHQDRTGDLWFGGWGGSNRLVRYNPRTREARQYTRDAFRSGSISSPSARTMYEDSSGTLWIGTWSGGLNRYDRQSDSFTTITENDGLSNNFVKGILADAEGRLWISTERGITRYDPRSGTFKRFTSEDGLQGDRFLSGSFTTGKDGWMYFGGENGFNAFHPDSIRDNPYIPPVVITSFRILDRSTPFPERVGEMPVVHLGYDQDFFSFEFVALSYTQPQHNQYAYIMEGFDRDWIHSGTRRYAAYTHLGGGTYTFRVKASNNDGIWNTTGSSILVIIDPPFWLTWWFWALLAAGVFMSLYAFYRYRVRRLLEVERLRTRIASDLHDELASNLTSIAMFGKIVQDAVQEDSRLPGGHLQLLERITTLSQESVSSIRDIIWTIDPRTETLGSLLQRLYDAIVTECNAHNITLRFHRPQDNQLPSHNLPPEQRRHLWMILKETLHNAIKHSGCSTITVSARYDAPELAVSIHDDGTGFDPTTATSGKGLGTLRMRAEQLGGLLTIATERNAGTTVELRCSL
jgi:ligand-binding sensor domain-containing protein/signal transduction histidine kinase